MVFAELLGGMINRGGERFRESELRRHALENWQRENDLQLRTNFLRENWANMTPEQQSAQLSQIEPLMGMKRGGLQALVTPAQAIHAILPSQAAPPELGAPRTEAAVTATPSAEAPTTIAGGKFAGQQIAAPASIQIGQIPTPAETVTPNIFARQPGQRIQSEPGRIPMTPNQILARQKFEQGDEELQQKIANIMNSDMSEEDKALAIKALYIPAGIITAQERKVSSPPAVGLSVIELTNPKNPRERMMVQATRTGQLVETGTGKVVSPDIASTWHKRTVVQPINYLDQSGTQTLLDREVLLEQQRQAGSVVGQAAGAPPAAEIKTPLVNPNTGKVEGEWGSRTGAGGANVTNLAKTPRSEATLQTITQIQNFSESIKKLEPLLEKHKNVVGRLRGNVEKGLAWAGLSDPEVDDMIGELNTIKTTYTYLVSGKQINEAEQARLSAVLPDIGQPEARLFNNMRRFKRIIGVMERVRQMGRAEGATAAELAAADRVSEARTKNEREASSTVNVRRRSDGKTAKVPKTTWDSMTDQQKSAYELSK